MRLAFVNHSRLQLPADGRPLDSGSIGIWNYEMATRLASEWDVVVYSVAQRGLRMDRREHGGAVFKSVPTSGHKRSMRLMRRLRSLTGAERNRKRPLFASGLYYGGYAARVAADMRRERRDVAHVTNFSQFAPIIRAVHPRARIVLHMQCDWLIQLDRGAVARRLRSCDLVSGCSEYIVDGIRRRFPEHAHKCFALHNGVDVARFELPEGHRAARGDDGSDILFVGRLSPEKGVHVLLEAFRRVADEVPAAKLTIIAGTKPAFYDYVVRVSDDPKVLELSRYYGSNGTSYLEHLEGLVPEALRGRVRFVDHVPQEQLRTAYADADVAVFPSVWNEPFGMVVVESMAAGVPVVCTRGGGVPEFVEDGRTGILVERGDPVQLADALIGLLRDGERRARIGAAGRARARAAHSWDVLARELDERLRPLVASVPATC